MPEIQSWSARDARDRASHIGVPQPASGRSHTGTLRLASTTPPAPSGSFTVRSSTVAASTTSLMARNGASGDVPGRADRMSGSPRSSVV